MIITVLLEHLDDDKDCPHCKHLLDNIFRASHITETSTTDVELK
jgi:hypothetical protein